jgi:undecaprenyl-diphosphatase
MFEVIILSIVQGVTEFLPISSSAHLILISNFFNFKNQTLNLDISLHAGSLIAIIIYYKNDLLKFSKNKVLFLKILISSIPVLICGYFLVKFNLIQELRNYKVIGCMTIIFGIFLYFADKKEINKKKEFFSLKSTVIIGIFQILSLIPGVSRSGITISAARLLNYDRKDSAKISFFLSIPVLTSVTLFNILNLYKINNLDFFKINILGIFLSFIFSFFTIKYFVNFINKYSFDLFVIYRIILGLIILFLIKW